SQFITLLQIMSKNQSAEMKAIPMFRQQRILLDLLPLVFLFSGFALPIGVMFYWLVSNFWTMGQQFIVIRNSPTPGSEAALAREAHLAKRDHRRRERTGITILEEEPANPAEPDKPVTTQRVQPPSKQRQNKQQKKRGGR